MMKTLQFSSYLVTPFPQPTLPLLEPPPPFRPTAVLSGASIVKFASQHQRSPFYSVKVDSVQFTSNCMYSRLQIWQKTTQDESVKCILTAFDFVWSFDRGWNNIFFCGNFWEEKKAILSFRCSAERFSLLLGNGDTIRCLSVDGCW